VDPHIRPATPNDLDPLAKALAPLPLLQRYGRTAQALGRSLATALQHGESLFIYDDHGPVGLAWVLPNGGLGLGPYLRLLAVAPTHHGRGIGQKLLEAFEHTTSRHALLLVSDFNTDAQRFYERHGYTKVGALPALVLADVNELLYWKRLPDRHE
jgi:GNAT superfamily N-acetyltransferase